MAQYIVNKTGTVHSIQDSWLAEKLASGARLATQDEINASFEAQGFKAKDAPKVGDLEKSYNQYLEDEGRNALIQSTTIGPRPGDVDVRMTQPGDPGFVIGTDGMRQVPSKITTQSLNDYGAAGTGQGVSEQDGHVYEAVVPEVAQASVVQGLPVEVAAAQDAARNSNEPTFEPTSVTGPTPAGQGQVAGDPTGGNTAGDDAAARDAAANSAPRAPKSDK